MGTDNRYLVQHLQQSPETLRGVAVIAPSASPQQLVDLHAQGVRGIRLNLAGQSHDMAPWQDAQTLWDTVLRLGWHVELHTDTGALPVVLAAVPAAVPVVIDHFGKPVRASVEDETVQAVQSRLAGDSPTQVYVKLSAAYRLQVGVSPTSLAQVWLGELGKKALLWGSDWPCTNFETKADYATLHDVLDDWLQNDKAVIQAVRTANPMGLYWGKH
jgi:predicted TIM-barrel fold metal-dependent hydrolase